MSAFEHRRAIFIGIACVLGFLGLMAVSSRVPKQLGTVQDTSFHFTFGKITQGTNHTIRSGIPALGLLNRALGRSGHGRISHDRLYSWSTAQPTTCFSVGFRHRGDILKKDPKNGLLYPIDAELLKAALVQQDGQSVALPEQGGG